MTQKKYDVLCIGNALYDVLSKVDDCFLADNGVTKGAMHLVDETAAEAIFSKLSSAETEPGGSAANTAAGLASFGVSCVYVGKVKNDDVGNKYIDGLKKLGVTPAVVSAEAGPSTGKSIVFVSHDGERTFNTYLGAAATLSPEDIDEAVVADSKIIYLEGYIWDKEPSKKAIMKLIQLAKDSGARITLSLSDTFCVMRHRKDFLRLVHEDLDMVFANEGEFISLLEAGSFDTAVLKGRAIGLTWVITRGPKGTYIIDRNGDIEVPAEHVPTIIDKTGAGDLYAAGFLAGLSLGKDMKTCAKLGSIASGEIISHFGARPAVNLLELAMRKKGL